MGTETFEHNGRRLLVIGDSGVGQSCLHITYANPQVVAKSVAIVAVNLSAEREALHRAMFGTPLPDPRVYKRNKK